LVHNANTFHIWKLNAQKSDGVYAEHRHAKHRHATCSSLFKPDGPPTRTSYPRQQAHCFDAHNHIFAYRVCLSLSGKH